MSIARSVRRRVILLLAAVNCLAAWTAGHDHSLPRLSAQRQLALTKAATQAEDPAAVDPQRPTCRVTVDLVDAIDGGPLAGLLRVTRLDNGKAVPLAGEIHRGMNWYAVGQRAVVRVPRTRLRMEAFHGIETELHRQTVDLSDRRDATLRLPLTRLTPSLLEGLRSGNTHLHLRKMTYAEALRYLRVVAQADGLDLVFLSHLRRLPDERDYISNEIVENSLAGGELQRLSRRGVLFSKGEEHRHNFGRGGEGYGHVMLLDIVNLIRPVSIGPGIMNGQGTDGIPLQRGIREARGQGATVIWCHNTFGFEDLPNWALGLLDAQNIFDGGTRGSYRDTFYKYLNLGLRVPFSTGTDWFVYDFSRVYVAQQEPMTSRRWLSALRAGRSYITNGTLLEFTVDGRRAGDTIHLAGPAELQVRGRAAGRNDFGGVELIHNGQVVHRRSSRPEGGHFVAEMRLAVQLDEPGWLAARIPLDAGKNELDQNLFAHTSPVYVELDGRRVFQPHIARELIAEIKDNLQLISTQATFANPAERKAVLDVHRAGIEALRQRLEEAQEN